MSQFWNDKIKSISPYVPGEQPKDKKYIKLNTNENPYPPSPNVIKSVKSMDIKSMRLYPDPDVTLLKDEIAKYFNLTKEQIFVGNGSDEILAFIFMAFFNKQDKVYYPDITYSFYPVYSDLFDLTEVQIPLDSNFEIKIEDYFGLDGHIIITNPNAPTSIALTLDKIESIIVNNPNNLVVVDEAYVDFGAESAVKLVDKYSNLLVVQTFSKSRSYAGMRLGYALGNSNIIEGLERLKFSFNSYTINRISIESGIESFRDEEYFQECRRKIMNTRDYTTTELEKLGFNVLDSKSNFLFISHITANASDLYQKLRDNGILVRYFSKPKIDNFLRVTIGTDEEMQEFIAKLQKII